MYTSISGVYENGKLTLLEAPPTQKKAKVIITFIEDEDNITSQRKLGGLEGKITLPDDFNEPLDDLKDYMF
ncbi:DUF2281 domain-containing protein [Salmonirosea aquatica]|uniref:DUF2281 domain-containing protein n=1 Tax=Salmonirosea aquatica TaxID=2654236 RepID=A0A7C9BH96_9BACT|nr:DUF2281 domain-containing protein [Cytophagaceae bacterium SJW1-29]